MQMLSFKKYLIGKKRSKQIKVLSYIPPFPSPLITYKS